ncbi:hypothetical protein ACP6PL_28370 [Dapis sp. BLCC M126]|uniref:hypothetical protein n=1 Tax=Dapis sp. BLCC M126 TaxID=3400189 RepID=UPI003CEF5E32
MNKIKDFSHLPGNENIIFCDLLILLWKQFSIYAIATKTIIFHDIPNFVRYNSINSLKE